MICAWCPDFKPNALKNRGVSHGICPACIAKLDAQLAMSQTSQTSALKDAA